MRKTDSFDRCKGALIKFLQNKPQDEIYYWRNSKSLTIREIISNIVEETDIGLNFIENSFLLAADLFDRNRESFKDFKRNNNG